MQPLLSEQWAKLFCVDDSVKLIGEAFVFSQFIPEAGNNLKVGQRPIDQLVVARRDTL